MWRPGIDKEYTYDRLNRITQVKTGGTVTERYAYSDKGRSITYYDGSGKAYTYYKDEYGRLTSETNRLGDKQFYSYNENGEYESSKDFNGEKTTVTYNANTRTRTTVYKDGTASYIKYNASGSIIEATGATGTITYTYDKGGMLIQQRDIKAGEMTVFRYDKAGRRVKMESGNREVTYSYGKNGELLAVTDSKQKLSVTYAYDNMGREKSRTFGNGVTQTTNYDKIGRTLLIVEKNKNGTLLRAEGYLYDEQGRRSHTVDEKGHVTKYFYDSQSRLKEVLYTYTEEKSEADKKEASLQGFYFGETAGKPERVYLSSLESAQLSGLLDLVIKTV